MLPQTVLLVVGPPWVFGSSCSFAMLLTGFPFAHVWTTIIIFPDISSSAFGFVIHKFTLIVVFVFPGESAVSVHHIVAPFSFVLLPTRPRELAGSTNNILFKVSFVLRAVSEAHLALSFFHIGYIIAFILRSIWPSLYPMTMLLVVSPLPVIVLSIDM